MFTYAGSATRHSNTMAAWESCVWMTVAGDHECLCVGIPSGSVGHPTMMRGLAQFLELLEAPTALALALPLTCNASKTMQLMPDILSQLYNAYKI